MRMDDDGESQPRELSRRATTDTGARPLSRVLPMGAAGGFVLGALVGFATVPDQVGEPALISFLGLLLGVGVAGATTMPSVPRPARATRPPRAPRAPLPPLAPAERGSPSLPAAVEADDEWVVPPGWYPDPRAERPARYWDGVAWTEHVAESRFEPAPGSQDKAPRAEAVPL
jgi:hypothetical protein